jgi:MFS family permease
MAAVSTTTVTDAIRSLENVDDGLLYRRVAWRLMPLLLLCYVVSNLDRINVSFAKLEMMSALKLSDAVYGLGAGLFFIGYAAMEVPSNWMLHNFGARIWISRILLTWGLLSAAMALVYSAYSFYGIRFALGIAEAGLFPGVMYYLTYWFPRSRRATITSIFYLAIPIAGVSGSVLSGFIMSEMDGWLGLAGWQWMFIIEAAPAVLLAPVVYFILSDKPEDADWLSRSEQQRLVRNLAGEQPDDHGGSVLQALWTPRVWHLGLILFTIVLALYGVLFYMPTLIRGAHPSSPAVIGLLTAIPYAVSVIMMVTASRNSDRTGERRWHLAFACFVGAVGITLSVFTKTNIVLVLVGMSLAVGGIMMCLGIYWTLATGVFRGAQDAVSIAFVNAIGLTAGFVGPTIIGAISSWTGSTDGGMIMLAVFWLIGAALILAYRHQHVAPALTPELSSAVDV